MDRAEKLQVNTPLIDLLRQILLQVNGELPATESSITPVNTTTVICVVEFDGCRYTLTRETCPEEEPPRVSLSPREKEIVRLVMKGHSNRAIAAVLDISPWTVSTHLRRVFGKLNVNSRAEMVACVLRESVVE